MIEKEFKELLQTIELDSSTNKDNNKIINLIIDLIENNINKNFKIINIINNSNPLIFDKYYELIILYNIKNKTFDYDIINNIILNEIENILYLNLKNNYFNNDLKFKRSDNILIIPLKDFNLIIKTIPDKDNLNNNEYNINDYNIDNDYRNTYIRKYNRFLNTINIIRYFMNSENIVIGINYLELLLIYGLTHYDSDNSIINNLKVFNNAISDLIDGKIISPLEEEYKNKKIFGDFINKDIYNLYNLSSKSLNYLNNDDRNIIIKNLKLLKSKIAMNLPRDGKFIEINVTPNYVIKEKTIEWSFMIIGTDLANSGGEYEYNDDNYIMCCHKALLKGLQYAIKNKLGKNIIIRCNTLKPFDENNLSYEGESRFANIINYIKDNDLMVDYKLL